jgi:outer membrane protein assembly factor BamD (BamD/ComL family)
MTDADEARYLARASNLLATFRQIAQDEHPNVIAEAALSFLAEALSNHPNRDEMVQHVLDQLRTIVDQIAEREPGESHQGSG